MPLLRQVPAEDCPAAAPTPIEAEPQVFDPVVSTNPVDGLDYCRIPPGEYWLGARPEDQDARSPERPRHLVRLTRAFWLCATPITVAAYSAFCKATSTPMPRPPAFNSDWAKGDQPVVNVSHSDALAYCEWAGGRLPTEAEWEYAASGLGSPLYPWGSEPDHNRGNFGKANAGPTAVHRYAANPYGLHDMGGNVWEWCADWFTPYPETPQVNPFARQRSRTRVLRGGSWLADWWSVRCTHRGQFPPDAVLGTVGLRCVWAASVDEATSRAA